METLLPAQVPSLDCVERFLYEHHNIHHSNSPASSPQSQLPPICDLESKVLCDLLFVQEEEAAQQQQQQQPRTPPVTVPDMENRMSPDSSSVEWHLQQQHPHQHQHNSLAHLAQLSSPASSMVSSPMSSSASSTSAMPQPDSTTADVHYDSDAFNSEDSTHTDEDENSNPILLQRQIEPEVVPVVKKKKKKSKRAGDVLLRCEEAHCGYTTRFKEHLTSHMHTHRADRNYMCHDCGQTFKWSHSLKRHQRTHRPADQVTFILDVNVFWTPSP